MIELSRRMRISFVIVVIGFFVASFAIYISAHKSDELINIFNEKEKLRTEFSNIQAAERSQRGYILTGNEKYLIPFEINRKELFDYIPAHIVFQKFEEMQRTIDLMKAGKQKEAIALIQTDEGLILMNTIEAQKIEALKKLERKEASLREITNHAKNVALIISVGTSVISAIILWVALYRYRQRSQLI